MYAAPPAKAFTTTFTVSGSWQAPAGVTSVTVEAWGGGGAGGGRTTTGSAGGGGGGAYAKKVITVTPLTSYSYTVGTGGAGGSGNGPDGGVTQWVTGTDVKAAGGKGGLSITTKGLGGATADSAGTTTFKGGDGADGPASVGGGGGGAAGSTAAGNNASGQTAGTGQTQDGGAGGAGGASNTNGTAASVYGGGGGGANRTTSTRTGGSGGAGAIKITYSSTSTLSTQVGYYMGDGTTTHAISGLGFTPDFVLIKSSTTAGVAAFKTRLMPDANMALVSATADNTASNLVLSNDGFTVGNSANVNSTNVRYTWIAFAGSDCTSSGIFCIGQFTGTGTATRTITTGFQPNMVMVKRTTAVAAHFHTASQPTNEIVYLSGIVRDVTGNFIKSFSSSGFDVGATDNAVGGVYNFIAFKSSANSFAEGTYAGNATDNRNITGLGFQPDIVMVKNATNVTATNTNTIMNTTATYGDYASTLNNTADAVNYVQALQSDGFQVGTSALVNGTGDTYYWMAFDGVAAPGGASGTFQMAVGSYTGTGATLPITGLGFTPDLVILKDSGANYQVFRTSMMKGDNTAYLSNAVANFAGGITSLDSDGFTIGTSTVTNTLGATIHYQAFGNAWDPETRTGASDFAVGAYMGNGLDNRNIIGLPWQPDFVALKRNSTSAGAWRSSAMTGDLTTFFGATAEAANYVQSFQTNGFQIGTNAAINTAANVHYWFAFKNGSNFAVGSYTGNSTDNRNITGVGFQPQLVWVKRSTAVNGVSRPSTFAGDTTQYFANLVDVSDRVQALQTDGFQVGGNQTETNTSGGTYRYAAWKPNIVISVTVSDGSVDYGNLLSGASQNTTAGGTNDSQIATNNGNIPEDFNLKTSAPAGWTLGASPGTDIFVHEFSTNGGSNWTKFITADVYQTLASNIAGSGGSQTFDLRLTSPNPSTSAAQKIITITVQATEH